MSAILEFVIRFVLNSCRLCPVLFDTILKKPTSLPQTVFLATSNAAYTQTHRHTYTHRYTHTQNTEYRIQIVFIVNQINPLYYYMLLFTLNVQRKIYFTNLYSHVTGKLCLYNIQSHYRNIMRTGLGWLNNVASPRSKAFTRTHAGNNRIR